VQVRITFQLILSFLSQNISQDEGSKDSPVLKQLPLYFLLKQFSGSFSEISNYQSDQFFLLFCELIDNYFTLQKQKEDKSETT
jgi:hypothetical protein